MSENIIDQSELEFCKGCRIIEHDQCLTCEALLVFIGLKYIKGESEFKNNKITIIMKPIIESIKIEFNFSGEEDE